MVGSRLGVLKFKQRNFLNRQFGILTEPKKRTRGSFMNYVTQSGGGIMEEGRGSNFGQNSFTF